MGFYYKTPLTFATIFPLITTNIFHPKIYCWDKPDDHVKKNYVLYLASDVKNIQSKNIYIRLIAI